MPVQKPRLFMCLGLPPCLVSARRGRNAPSSRGAARGRAGAAAGGAGLGDVEQWLQDRGAGALLQLVGWGPVARGKEEVASRGSMCWGGQGSQQRTSARARALRTPGATPSQGALMCWT